MKVQNINNIDCIVNFAAQTHVDRSIDFTSFKQYY